MKRIIIFSDPDWALGAIHYELAKRLHAYGYNCMVLPWNRSYTRQEIQELDQVTDLYLTSLHGWMSLGYFYGDIRPEKVAVMVYAKLDVSEFIHKYNISDFDKFYSYACCSEWLRDYSRSVGIKREAALATVAINYDWFFGEPSKKLEIIGFAGSYHERDEFSVEQLYSVYAQPKFRKRGYLAKEVAQKLGLQFKIAQNYHNSFVTMNGFYKSIDCLIIPGSEEAGGMPILEGGAAGKLVVSTPIGHWQEKIVPAGAVEVPIPEKEFLEKTCDVIQYYVDRPKEYRDKCYEIREHAKTYDWSNVIDSWISLISRSN